MTIRRGLIGVAGVITAIAILFAVRPFHASAGFTVSDAGGNGRFLVLSDQSCRAPIVDAWRGRRADAATVPAGIMRSGLHGLFVTQTTTVTVCRGEARHRLILGALGLVGALAIAGFALFGRRPRLGEGPASLPA